MKQEKSIHRVKTVGETTNTQPLRVLHILGSAQCGGTESVVFNNYRKLDRNKVQFDLAIHNDSPVDIPQDIKALGCRVFRIPSYSAPFSYVSAIKKICRKEKYRIVHSHMNAMSVFPLFAARLAGVPVRIAHSHSTSGGGKDFKRDVLKSVLRPLSKLFATHYFACSEHAARWLFGNKAFEDGRVLVLNNAIDTGRFAFNSAVRDYERGRLGVEGKFVVGHVGRFSPPKNHVFLIEAFHALTKIRDDCVLLLIGGLGSAGGGIEEKLHKRVDELGLTGKVIFNGVTEDIGGLYQAMDVFTLPSLFEGLGIACIEAQCSGLPCVLSDGVPRESKINENVRFLSLKVPPDEWAKAISGCISQRADYSDEIKKAGYDINQVAKILERAYLSYVKE